MAGDFGAAKRVRCGRQKFFAEMLAFLRERVEKFDVFKCICTIPWLVMANFCSACRIFLGEPIFSKYTVDKS